jgi:hypothetical protein
MEGIMKKIAVSLILVISVMLIASCKTAKSVPDETFKNIYDKYYDGLIFDGVKRYTVKKGDTLTSISNAFYGSGFYFPLIMLASRNVVLDHDKILPGMVLLIPNLQINMDDPKARESIKGVIMDSAAIEDSRGRRDTAAGLRNHANSL